MPTITVKLDKKRAARSHTLGAPQQSPEVRGDPSPDDRAGPIETGDDLIEWVEHSAGKGLGLAQTKA